MKCLLWLSRMKSNMYRSQDQILDPSAKHYIQANQHRKPTELKFYFEDISLSLFVYHFNKHIFRRSQCDIEFLFQIFQKNSFQESLLYKIWTNCRKYVKSLKANEMKSHKYCSPPNRYVNKVSAQMKTIMKIKLNLRKKRWEKGPKKKWKKEQKKQYWNV